MAEQHSHKRDDAFWVTETITYTVANGKKVSIVRRKPVCTEGIDVVIPND